MSKLFEEEKQNYQFRIWDIHKKEMMSWLQKQVC